MGRKESYVWGREKMCRKKEVMCGEEGKLCVGKRESYMWGRRKVIC